MGKDNIKMSVRMSIPGSESLYKGSGKFQNSNNDNDDDHDDNDNDNDNNLH